MTQSPSSQMNLLINSNVCTGCRLCELICSMVKEKESDPAKARIYIETYMLEGLRIPRVCVNCANPPCVKVCERGALQKDEVTGIIVLDYIKCDHCAACISACPFGAIRLTPENKVIKCDLCGGEPECVKICETEAIQFAERKPQKLTTARSYSKSRATAEGELIA